MRIYHVLRAPQGGLFRHVRDLVRAHRDAGHDVGLACDSSFSGAHTDAAFEALAAQCTLGILRLPMPRLPGLGDLAPLRRISAELERVRPDILHGHGAKGGLYARLGARRSGLPSVYTPHGGSLHYAWRTPAGALFLAAERALRPLSSGLLFVCEFERRAFDAKIGLGALPSRVVHNGLWPDEFEPVTPAADPTDLLFLGELRELKGLSDLLQAMALLEASRSVTLTVAGEGPERQAFEAEAARLGLSQRVRFTGAMPARRAFAMGRIFVMPSRAEAFPYVVLEAAASGLPIIATAVGGIPEILPPQHLVPPRDVQALATAIARALDQGPAAALKEHVRERFSAPRMAEDIASFYAQVLQLARPGARS